MSDGLYLKSSFLIIGELLHRVLFICFLRCVSVHITSVENRNLYDIVIFSEEASYGEEEVF